jgi:pimeloyl-ACP methyl ester carboxylesterase
MHNPALPHLLRYVDAPVMLVRGSRDRIVPASCLDAYASVLPNAARRTLNGGGHFLEIEMAADVAAITFEFFSTI